MKSSNFHQRNYDGRYNDPAWDEESQKWPAGRENRRNRRNYDDRASYYENGRTSSRGGDESSTNGREKNRENKPKIVDERSRGEREREKKKWEQENVICFFMKPNLTPKFSNGAPRTTMRVRTM